MGCSYYGYAVIGVEINIGDLTASELVRNFGLYMSPRISLYDEGKSIDKGEKKDARNS